MPRTARLYKVSVVVEAEILVIENDGTHESGLDLAVKAANTLPSLIKFEGFHENCRIIAGGSTQVSVHKPDLGDPTVELIKQTN